MQVVAAHDVLRVVDCVAFGCIDEAERGSDRCWRHRVALAEATRPEPVVAEPGICKIEGCTRQHNTRYSRGIFAKLCDPHIEEARERASQRGRKEQVSRPEPAATPSPGDDGFEARLALDAATAAHAGAQLAWEDARLALTGEMRVEED